MEPQIPKFDTATQAIHKSGTAARHNLKIDMRHAIEATRNTFPLLSATNDTILTDTKLDKCGVSFFFPEAILGLVGVFCEALSKNNAFEP